MTNCLQIRKRMLTPKLRPNSRTRRRRRHNINSFVWRHISVNYRSAAGKRLGRAEPDMEFLTFNVVAPRDNVGAVDEIHLGQIFIRSCVGFSLATL